MENLQEIKETYENRLEEHKEARQRIVDEMKKSDNTIGNLYLMELIKYDAVIEEIDGLLDFIYYLIDIENEEEN